MTYRIREWDTLFENNRTREMKRMDWVPIPNRMDGNGYLTLVSHRHGAAHFGAWIAILEIASRCPVRGTLTQASGGVHTASTLARVSRMSVEVISTALRRLVEVGWIDLYDETAVANSTVTLKIPQEPAPRATRARTEENGTERNGTEEKGIELVRDTFPQFLAACDLAEMNGSEADLKTAHSEWNRLDLGQQLAACQGIKDRVAAGELADPGFRPLPQNYLKNKTWQRTIRRKQEPAGDKQRAHRNEVLALTKLFGGMKT